MHACDQRACIPQRMRSACMHATSGHTSRSACAAYACYSGACAAHACRQAGARTWMRAGCVAAPLYSSLCSWGKGAEGGWRLCVLPRPDSCAQGRAVTTSAQPTLPAPPLPPAHQVNVVGLQRDVCAHHHVLNQLLPRPVARVHRRLDAVGRDGRALEHAAGRILPAAALHRVPAPRRAVPVAAVIACAGRGWWRGRAVYAVQRASTLAILSRPKPLPCPGPPLATPRRLLCPSLHPRANPSHPTPPPGVTHPHSSSAG